jgi:hypothetical protein
MAHRGGDHAYCSIGTHFGVSIMNPFGLLIVAGGLFLICGAAFDWEFFINCVKTGLFVVLLGRTGARIVYAVLGTALLLVGAVMTLEPGSQPSMPLRGLPTFLANSQLHPCLHVPATLSLLLPISKASKKTTQAASCGPCREELEVDDASRAQS